MEFQIVRYVTLLALLASSPLVSDIGLHAAESPAVCLVREGKPLAALVLPAEPHEDERLAAEELHVHLEKMTGANLPIVSGQPPEGLVPVRIGLALVPDAEARIRKQSNDPAAFSLTVRPGSVELAGLSPEGTLFAAYELLEQLGVRWYMPGELGTVIPKTKTVALQVGRSERVPSFPHRHLQTVSKRLPWFRRQRLGGLHFPGSHGIRMLPRADFEKEPELFSLVDGRRARRQTCISNPEVAKRATAYSLNYFEKHPEAPWIGMGPNDGGGFCECEHCRKLDSGEWDPYAAELSMTDRYVWLFNQILREVHKKYPGKKIGFYAYHSYKLPPRKHQPDPHIVPAFAPITLCRIHGMSNPICPDRSFYRTLMVEWGKIVPETFERGYYFNLACPAFPFSKVHAIRDETRVAHDAGVKGWRVECMPAWATSTSTLYVAARLMWDVDTDVDALLAEFHEKFFGPATEPMGEYLQMIDHAFRDTDCHAGASYCMPQVFTTERRDRGRKLLEQAARKAADEEPFQQRVRIYRLNFDRLEAFLAMLDARNCFDFVTAQKSLDDLRRITDVMLDFRLYPSEPPADGARHRKDDEARLLWWRSAHSYVDRFWSRCTEDGHERTVVRGELAAGCPDQWDFLIDTTDVGEAVGWFRDGPLGGNWQKIRTRTASWSDQGLHYYKGLAWYRVQVAIPERFEGRTIYVWFGGVDEKAKVWLNGKLLGQSDAEGPGLPGVRGAFRPFEFDVTKAVRFGAMNSLVVKIANHQLNELGTGGIVAPVMFWSPKE